MFVPQIILCTSNHSLSHPTALQITFFVFVVVFFCLFAPPLPTVLQPLFTTILAVDLVHGFFLKIKVSISLTHSAPFSRKLYHPLDHILAFLCLFHWSWNFLFIFFWGWGWGGHVLQDASCRARSRFALHPSTLIHASILSSRQAPPIGSMAESESRNDCVLSMCFHCDPFF